jgi:O-antigen/teichoic acid export membrane protein
MQGTFAVPLSAGLRLGWVTTMDLLRQVLTVALVVALVLGGAGLLAFLGIPIPVGILVLGATVAVARGAIPLRPAFEPREWRLLLRAVLPFAGAVAIGSIYLRLTVVMTSLIASDVQTGYYATAYRVLEVLIAIPALVVGSTLPVLARAARDDRERLVYVLQRLFEATLIVGAGLAVMLALGAPFAIEVLAGGKSDPSIPVLQIQALALVANFVATSFSYGLLSLHRHRELLVTASAALVLSLALTLALVPWLEAQGAALAFTLGEVAVALLALVFVRRAQPDARFPLRTVACVAAAAAAAASLALVPGLPSLARALVGAVIFFGVLIGLRAIPPELIDAFVRRPQASSEKNSS